MDKPHRYDNAATSKVVVKVALLMSLAALIAVVAVPLVSEQQWEPMHTAAMPAAHDDPAPGHQSAERNRSDPMIDDARVLAGTEVR